MRTTKKIRKICTRKFYCRHGKHIPLFGVMQNSVHGYTGFVSIQFLLFKRKRIKLNIQIRQSMRRRTPTINTNDEAERLYKAIRTLSETENIHEANCHNCNMYHQPCLLIAWPVLPFYRGIKWVENKGNTHICKRPVVVTFE